MWGVIPKYIRRNINISDKAKLLYAEISDCTEDDGCCRKSNEELASYLGVSTSTLRNYLYELRDLELICVDGDGKDRSISFPEKLVHVDVKKEKRKNNLKVDLTEEIVDLWNSKITTVRGINVTDGLIKTITSRSKSFSDQEIIDAVKNRIKFVINSEWHNRKENRKHRNDIHLVLRSDADLQKSLLMDLPDSEDENSIIVSRIL